MIRRPRTAVLATLLALAAVSSVPPGTDGRGARVPGLRAARAEGSLPPGLKPGSKPGEAICERDGALMVLVPEGAFTMGVAKVSTTDDVEAMPAHEEKTGRYWIDVTEVTNARYAKFLAAIAKDGHKTCPKDEPEEKDHRPLDWRTPEYDDPKFGRSCGPDYPVCGVDWYDARAYAAWAGKRLPTEAEWEKAARGTDARPFPWGTATPTSQGKNGISSPDETGVIRANWRDDADGYSFAAPVGKFPQGRSPYGCEDMGGNAWEWTDSPFTLYPGHFENLDTLYPPERCAELRVFRGGSFMFGTMDLQTTHRHWIEPESRQPDMGLRCVVSAP